MAKSAGAGAPPKEAALMTDRALEWMSYRRSGKIGDLPSDLIGAASERRFVDDMVTLGHTEWTAPNAWRIAPRHSRAFEGTASSLRSSAARERRSFSTASRRLAVPLERALARNTTATGRQR